jgi:shikimate kinase
MTGGGPTAPPRRIVLVGFMGCGKTTVGRELARQLGWTFCDLDERIEARLGLSIPQVFERHGEAFFRAEELREARQVALEERTVLAAGGGAFAQPATRQALRSGAATVWLRCPFEVLERRVPGDGSRPLAVNRERMRELHTEREKSYEMADISVDTVTESAAEVARHIVGLVWPQGQAEASDRRSG